MAAPLNKHEKSENCQNGCNLEKHDEWSDFDDDELLTLVEKCEKTVETTIMTDDVDCNPVADKHAKNHDEQPKSTCDNRVPLERFRPGYLWVSDLTRQHWCEQQMWYSLTLPVIVEENPVMTEGSNLHLARELAVHDVVKVKVESSEDIWGIKVLNLISSVQCFLNGVILAREIPIFGAPFGEDIFIVGLIDELRFDPQTYTIDLQELKTRKHKSPPSRSQQGQHRLQVMLYKKLFDDLVKGQVSKETVAKHLKLNLTKEFGEDISRQIDGNLLTCKNLNELMDVLFQKMQCLTCISQIGIEYVHQESKQTICHHTFDYSESELESMVREYYKFWRGGRESKGVDIEDAWKCQMCDFASVCEWRQRKADEYSKRNFAKKGAIT